MGYTRIPAATGVGAITNVGTESPIPIRDPATSWYHPIPGSGVIQNVPPSAIAPSLSAADTTQFSGTYIIGDNVVLTATTSDSTDNLTTTSVDLYESSVLVGSMLQGPAGTWTRTVSSIAVGAKSYTARRHYTPAGIIDSSPVAFTVADVLSPSAVTSATLIEWWDETSFKIATAPIAAGTSPPNITFGGTLQQQIAPVVKVHTLGTGAPGNTTVDIYIDGGTTPLESNISTAAGTHTVSGGGGLTVIFPGAGTYSANNTWTGAHGTYVAKVSAGTNDLTQPTAGTLPVAFAGSEDGGGISSTFDGVNDRIRNATSGSWNTAFGGTNTSFYICMVMRLVTFPTSPNAVTMFSAGNGSDANSRIALTIQTSPTTNFLAARFDASGTGSSLLSNVIPSAGYMVAEMFYDGSTGKMTLRWNGADMIGGNSGVDGTFNAAGAITLNEFCIGCRLTNTAINFSNMRFYQGFIMNHLPTDAVEYARMMRNFG